MFNQKFSRCPSFHFHILIFTLYNASCYVKEQKRTKFYHITVILQYYWDKTIAWSGHMYRDDLGISTLVIKCFGITNTSVQNFAIRISSVKTVPKCLRKLKVYWTFNIDVASLLMSSLRAIVIYQKYFDNHVISSQIHHLAPLLNMRRFTPWILFFIT